MTNVEISDFEESAAEAGQPRTSTEEIHATIRNRICLLEYAPGSLLREAALAVEFGVSRTPIREILQRLAQEGLVKSRNGVGTLVRPLDFDQIEDIYEMRLRIAPLIGELSPRPVLFQTHVERAEDLLRRARALASVFDLREYWNVNHDLHFVVGGLIGNVALAEMWDKLASRRPARCSYKMARSLGVAGRALAGARDRGHAGSTCESGDITSGWLHPAKPISLTAFGSCGRGTRLIQKGQRLPRNKGDRPR